MAAADEPQIETFGARGTGVGEQPAGFGDERCRGDLHLPISGGDEGRQAGTQRPQIDPAAGRAHFRQGDAAAAPAQDPVRADRDPQGRRAHWAESGEYRVEGPAGQRTHRQRQDLGGQPGHDLPVLETVRRGVDRPRVVANVVVHAEHGQQDVEILAFQRRYRRQDDIGVAGGFGDVHIHGHIEIERTQRLVQLPALRGGEYWISGIGDHGADLLWSLIQDFGSQSGHGQFEAE